VTDGWGNPPPALRRLAGGLARVEQPLGHDEGSGCAPAAAVVAAEALGAAGSRDALSGATRQAAVLVLLTNELDPRVLLTVRAPDLHDHANQVSFPGGSLEAGETAVAAALREAWEEVGLPPGQLHLLGELPPAEIEVSRFAVRIIVAWWSGQARLKANPDEVTALLQVPVSRLADPQVRFTWRHPRRHDGPGFALGEVAESAVIWPASAVPPVSPERSTPSAPAAFEPAFLDGVVVWGFTAHVLDYLLAVGGWERSWEQSAVYPVPARFLPPADRR